MSANTQTPTDTPSSWSLYGSDTGLFTGEEVLIESRSGLSWYAGETKEFFTNASVAYKSYRWKDLTAITAPLTVGEPP